MLDENDYDDDDDDDPRDPVIVLKEQKYTTWLYILLLMVSLYVLFYINLTKQESKTITISNISPLIFNELYLKYAATLTCPCSTITVPYNSFVNNTVIFHPVCSSIFVSQQWIQALYLINASRYGVTDFRTTANSQFQLLTDLCSLSQRTVLENQIDFGNNEFVTTNLVPEVQIQSVVNVTVEFFKNSISTQIILFLNYIRTSNQANYIISALNTNMVSRLDYTSGYGVSRLETQYFSDTFDDVSSTEAIVCGGENPTSIAGFFSTSTSIYISDHLLWSIPTASSDVVNGFFGGCTPLEALLQSTLGCLYDIKCLQLLINYFPALRQMNFNVNNSVLSSKQQNITVNDHLINLFIEEWSTEMNYSKYFHDCTPKFCSYTITDQANLFYALTLFVSLYGGLIIIFRSIAPFLINILLKFKYRLRNTNINSTFHNTYANKFIQSMKRLNLFKVADDRSENSIKKQRIMTRVYLTLLSGSFLVLLFFTSLNTEIVTITKSNPSLITYNNLQILYSNTLQCPCSTTTIPYQTFISLSPILHQVCSSDFVDDRWLSIVKAATDYLDLDWRNTAFSQFQLLSALCRLANNTIDDAVNRFLLQSFIASSVLPEFDFDTQLNATLNQFFQSTIISFSRLVDTVGLLLQVDQLHLGTLTTFARETVDENIWVTIVTNKTTYQQSLQLKLLLNGVHDVNSLSINCICGTNPHCQSPVAIYDYDFAFLSKATYTIGYIVPHSVAGCSTFNSVMLSQFGCLYADSNCFSILMNYIRYSYLLNIEYPSWFDARPLVYDSTLSRYPPNISISEIVKEILLEKWNPSYSYDRFYDLCAPRYCTYSERIRAKTIIAIIIELVALIGGLTMSLRLLTRHIAKSIFGLLATTNNPQQQQLVRLKWYEQIKVTVRKLATLIYNTTINLNIFALRDLGSNVNRVTAKRYGKWATRLYIILLIIGLTILALYAIIQPQTVTSTFEKPSYNYYNQLKQNYGDKLKCSCSSIASKYNRFVNIEAIFHEVCTSPFSSEQLRINLTAGLTFDLYIYGQRDYRRYLSAHLQFLQGLCELSIESINNSINQLLSSLFITAELLSEKDFNNRLVLLIEQSKSNAPITFTRLLYLIRSINQGNAFISNYGTNFEYIYPWGLYTYYYVPTQAIIYDNGCSCGLYSNCTTQASFIEASSSNMIPIKGLKIGCTPSESFRASTLECFYNQSCLNLIQQYTNYSNRIIPLSGTVSHFSFNTSIAELIDNLFVEQWLITKNYSSYFEQCLPLLCSYTYIQKFNLLYTITVLLGLQGGLTIVLGWICPKIIRIVVNIYEYRKRRTNLVQPINSLEMTPVEIVNRNIHSITRDIKSIPSINVTSRTHLHSPSRRCFKFVIMCHVMLFVIAALIIFSIYVYRQQRSEDILISSSTSTTASMVTNIKIITTTTTTTSSTTHLPACRLKFQLTTSYTSGSTAGLKSPVAADFNRDNLTDVAFFNYATARLHVWLGNGNGSFGRRLTTYVYAYDGWSFMMTVGDFNNDNRVDLTFTNENDRYVGIMLGNGDGTFRTPKWFAIGSDSYMKGITVSDFNRDGNLDVAVIDYWNNYMVVIFGNGDGTLSTQNRYYIGRNTYPLSIGVADFNGDGYQDIAVTSTFRRFIGVFLGHANGTFDEPILSFTGGYYVPYFLAITDFNGDHRPDVVFGYDVANTVGVLFGYGNGSLGGLVKFVIGNVGYYPRIAVGDFNSDNHMDIIVGPIEPYNVSILVGYGNGEFEMQTVFSTGLSGGSTWVDVADFNGDGCQDILASDDDNGAVFIVLNTCECRTTENFTTSTYIHL